MLSIEHVYKNFGKKEVLSAVCLNLEKGCYGLLGPNGAGKTTLLRMILKLYPVRRGSIWCDGAEEIGYLPQKFGAFRELTVYDILYYFAALKKIPKKMRGEEITRVLRLVNLSDREKDKMGSLSGGMQRRVGIAQAALGDPGILIFDEPTAGLDPEERARFKELVRQIMEGKTILLSTHIVEDVESLCDHVIIMNQGRILESLTTDEAGRLADGEEGLEAGYLSRIHRDRQEESS